MTADEPAAKKPVPVADPDSRPYWNAARNGELVLQSCGSCGEYQFYPRALCRGCWSKDLDFVAVPGTGSIYAFTISHVAGQPGYEQDIPYSYALVEVDLPDRVPTQSPVRLPSRIVDCDHEVLRIGLPVEVAFSEHDADPSVVLPVFRPTSVKETG